MQFSTFSFRVCLDSAESVCVCVFSSFFFHAFQGCYGYCSCTVYEQQPQSLTCQTIFSQSVHTVHCSWTHKFHFSTTFSLKMGLTILFTYLKIILLQCFSVSVFSFQLYPNGPLVFYSMYLMILNFFCEDVLLLIKRNVRSNFVIFSFFSYLIIFCKVV